MPGKFDRTGSALRGKQYAKFFWGTKFLSTLTDQRQPMTSFVVILILATQAADVLSLAVSIGPMGTRRTRHRAAAAAVASASVAPYQSRR